MTPEELRSWLEGNDPPWVLRTKGGRSYKIPGRSNIWLPEACPEMMGVALPGRGVIIIRMSTIESISSAEVIEA